MKQSKIVLPGDKRFGKAVQQSLFIKDRGYDPNPTIINTVEGVRRILYERQGNVGLDLEYQQRNDGSWYPSILGIASRDFASAVAWNEVVAKEVADVCSRSGRLLVAFNTVGADKDVLDRALGSISPLRWWGDAMLTHYDCNRDFCKTTYKDDDEGSLGFMNLWTAASMTTMVPNWKICRGKNCSLINCPTHDVFSYCALDAWAGLQIYEANLIELKKFGYKDFLLQDTLELSEICYLMEQQGLAIDWDYVAQLNKEMKEHKDAIFEFEWVGKEKRFKNFNPNAPAQVIAWFEQEGIYLEKSDKRVIFKELERLAKRLEVGEVDDLLAIKDTLAPKYTELIKLYEYKSQGKGCDPWFGPKYKGKDGFIHPRFILTGASSGRLASSRPNFQNIGKRGWAKKLKRCIIPRHSGLDFLESDSSQLELRVCLWEAGANLNIADHIFEELVAESDGKYLRASEMNKQTERDTAKSIVHAADYMESLTILSENDLKNPRTINARKEGALHVHEDWEYGGGVIGFTGINIADRILGNHTLEARKVALELRDQYIKKVPEIEKWHRDVLKFIDKTGYTQLPTGEFLRLHGDARERAKIGVATHGQGGGARYIKSIMLKFKREHGRIPVLNVHDSLVFEVPKEMSNKEAYEFMSLMYTEVKQMPGFKAPGKATRGKNYGELEPLNV